MPSRNQFAILISIAALVVFVSAFMPWGDIHGAAVQFPMQMPSRGEGFPFGGVHPLQGLKIDIAVTGWNGNITLGGLVLPNWLVILATAGVASLSWLKATATWCGPAAVSFALAAYGAFHSGYAFFMLQFSQQGTAGVGSIITTLAFIGMLVILGQEYRKPLSHQC